VVAADRKMRKPLAEWRKPLPEELLPARLAAVGAEKEVKAGSMDPWGLSAGRTQASQVHRKPPQVRTETRIPGCQ